mmetsp:Transcript_61736/g.116219  ORF Transcript_61736/g.116219 Transcript_61736/m.116219 type:complete len:206 (-) Transcript_61736:569-1186(-)
MRWCTVERRPGKQCSRGFDSARTLKRAKTRASSNKRKNTRSVGYSRRTSRNTPSSRTSVASRQANKWKLPPLSSSLLPPSPSQPLPSVLRPCHHRSRRRSPRFRRSPDSAPSPKKTRNCLRPSCKRRTKDPFCSWTTTRPPWAPTKTTSTRLPAPSTTGSSSASPPWILARAPSKKANATSSPTGSPSFLPSSIRRRVAKIRRAP